MPQLKLNFASQNNRSADYYNLYILWVYWYGKFCFTSGFRVCDLELTDVGCYSFEYKMWAKSKNKSRVGQR